MKHDSAMQFWRPDGEWEMFAGENYRMDELRAALALAQLKKMPSILEGCRRAKRHLCDLTSHLPGIRQQRFHDAAGDCGISFVFFLETRDLARQFSEMLATEGVPNQTVYNKQIPDRHVYAAWDYVMEKKTHDHTGWPWTAAHRPIEYHREMLPQTLDVLGRCIAIGLNQRWEARHTTLVARAIEKVHSLLVVHAR
jgi:8-amino-3,8-dideoxy-alpha-D-manno-octulosonate transaminase